MEPLTIFAITLALVGIVHLLSTAVNRFGKGIYNYGNKKNKRDDWYCFFKTTTLLGENQKKSRKKNDRPSPGTEVDKLDQRRRQQANRPRLHL